MKTFFRLLIVFGILDGIVAAIEFIRGDPISPKIILGVICLLVGSTGLFVIKAVSKR